MKTACSSSSLLISLFVYILTLVLHEFLKTTVLLKLIEMFFVLFILDVTFLLISWLETFLNTILVFGFELRKSSILLHLGLKFLIDQFFFCYEISYVFKLLFITRAFGPLPKHFQVFELAFLLILKEFIILHRVLIYL